MTTTTPGRRRLATLWPFVRRHLPSMSRRAPEIAAGRLISVSPVGLVHTERSDPGNSDHWGAVESTILVEPRFGDRCLAGLAEFSHVEVVFFFDRVRQPKWVDSLMAEYFSG